jgi:chromosome partitioning protein
LRLKQGLDLAAGGCSDFFMAEKTNNDFYLSVADLALFLKTEPTKLLSEIEKKLGPQDSKVYLKPAVVRRYLATKGFQYPQKVISFQMLKGGVAKTTSCLNFGIRAAMYGASVLFIDLDQQANLSFALGVEDESLPVWVDLLEKKAKISELRIRIDEKIDLIPSSLNNSVLDRVLLSGNRNWAQAVKGPLNEIMSEYDLVLIDTAPNLSAINTAVTCASNQVVLPINPDKFSLLGLNKHLEDLAELRKEFSLEFEEKILFTKFDGRESSSHEILTQVMDSFADQLLKNYIRTSSEIKNAIRSSKSLYRAKSNAKEDYDSVTKELLGWI